MAPAGAGEPVADSEPHMREDRLAVVERWVMVVLYVALITLGCLQVLKRHGLSVPFSRLEELMPNLFIGITFLGMPLAYRWRGHLAVEIVPALLPRRWQRAYHLGLWLVTGAFLLVIGFCTINVMQFQLEINAVTTMGYPAVFLTGCLLLGVCGSILRLLQYRSDSAVAAWARSMTVILALFGLMVLLLALGLQIWIAIGLTALLPMLAFGIAPLDLLPQMMLSAIDSWSLLAVPLFILAGAIISESSIGQRLIELSNALFGMLPGGLAVSSVFTCLVFGGLTGSATADAAGVTSIMARPMERSGYSLPYIASLIAAAGTLANLVPPSLGLLLYGIVAKVSISDLFVAGILPGLLNAVLLALTAAYLAERRGFGHAARMQRMPVGRAFARSIWALIAPALILGGIRLGVFTPTESAVFVVIYVFLVAKFVYRDLSWRDMPAIIERAAVTSGAIMLIVATAAVLSWIIETQGLAATITSLLQHGNLSKSGVIFAIVVILVLSGMVLEPAPMLLIVVPLLLPVAHSIGMNLVQFGVVVIAGVNLGLIHPPVGLALFVAAKVARAPLASTFYASLWWVPVYLLVLLLVAYIPALSLQLL